MVGRRTSAVAWAFVASGTMTNAMVIWRVGINEYAVWTLWPNGQAYPSPSVWTFR